MNISAKIRLVNNNRDLLNGESISISWNSGYFANLTIINFYIYETKLLTSNFLNNDNLNSQLSPIPNKIYTLPNTGYYNLVIPSELKAGSYLIIGNNPNNTMEYLLQNGLITKPFVVLNRPNINKQIMLISPKLSRPYGNNESITVKYNSYLDLPNKVLFHLYAINPLNHNEREHRQVFENMKNEINLIGLSHHSCITYYMILVQQLEYPFHQDSSEIFWVLPNSEIPFTKSKLEIDSFERYCYRQNLKYGILPTLTEFGIITAIIICLILGITCTLYFIHNIYNTSKKLKYRTNNNRMNEIFCEDDDLVREDNNR
ncbi:hypothetical protein cand_022100 [Cryptosporidium andersoni]|uniref:Uncharacterized protein n=1 Tax=Cryptosporidium andersoni TaxID=117008 RepID=A0A1J4MUI6_9CRYT|nr:hypothetical protein cand_022100 [Cryptosporidium andersoni]